MRIAPFGERAILVELGDEIDEALASRASALAALWEGAGFGPAVSTYASALLRFDPLRTPPSAAEEAARAMAASVEGRRAGDGRLVEIPVRYGGPDLASVARASAVSVERLIALHAGREYHVYFLGFAPGFPYCGRLDPAIVAPRLARPRERVPAGSVGIADGQTGIYPFPLPGGWNIIGATELVLFDARRDPPALLRAGDRVRFIRRS